MAFDDRSVLVDGGDALPVTAALVEIGNSLHATGLDLLQRLQSSTCRHDEAQLGFARRTQLFQTLIVEQRQKPP